MGEKIIAFILLVLVFRLLWWLVKLPFRLLSRVASGRRGCSYAGSVYSGTHYGSSGHVRAGSDYSEYTPDPEPNDPYYEDLYEVYYGEKPKGRITVDEMCELEEFEDEEWDEDECCG